MKRILIADGDADSCGYIGRILIRRKICDSIDVVDDGAYVCEKLVSGAYGLAIIELDLPGCFWVAGNSQYSRKWTRRTDLGSCFPARSIAGCASGFKWRPRSHF